MTAVYKQNIKEIWWIIWGNDDQE